MAEAAAGQERATIRTLKAIDVFQWLFLALALLVFVLSSNAATKPAGARANDGASKDQHADKATFSNAASLLDDLLNQEKNVSKILIIKHPGPAVSDLVKQISKTADEGAKQIEALAKSDPSLNLKAMNLPPGETGARAAEAKTTEHGLLSTSGPTFAFNLLMSQAQAMGYGSNLARVAAESASTPEQAKQLSALSQSLGHLNERVIAMMKGSVPPKKD